MWFTSCHKLQASSWYNAGTDKNLNSHETACLPIGLYGTQTKYHRIEACSLLIILNATEIVNRHPYLGLQRLQTCANYATVSQIPQVVGMKATAVGK